VSTAQNMFSDDEIGSLQIKLRTAQDRSTLILTIHIGPGQKDKNNQMTRQHSLRDV
ncbi:Hypothetical predicted protein, partial [Mytilus galloprovincialis]